MNEKSYTEEDKKDPFGRYAHDCDCPKHSGKKGHYCTEWDDLWICEDCEEFEVCLCFQDEAA